MKKEITFEYNIWTEIYLLIANDKNGKEIKQVFLDEKEFHEAYWKMRELHSNIAKQTIKVNTYIAKSD